MATPPAVAPPQGGVSFTDQEFAQMHSELMELKQHKYTFFGV